MEDLAIQEGLVLPAGELSWRATRASGPGGQNVNKVATRVELRFDFWASPLLSEEVKLRLDHLARGRRDRDGCLLVTSQATREQARNLEDARDKLRTLVLRALEPPPSPRKRTRPSRAARQRRLDAKKRLSAKKRERRWRDD